MSEKVYQKFRGELTGAQARDNVILESLRKELIGPSPVGEPLTINDFIHLSEEDFKKDWIVASTGEEIIKEYPVVRYGMGALYTKDFKEDNKELEDAEEQQESDTKNDFINTTVNTDEERSDEGYDIDLSLANARLPQSFAISFVSNISKLKIFRIKVTGGIYKPFKIIKENGKEAKWWYREAFSEVLEIVEKDWQNKKFDKELIQANHPLFETKLRLVIHGILRELQNGESLITVSLVNKSSISDFKSQNTCTLFQTSLKIELERLDGSGGALPYPESDILSQDEEVLINQLLYRNSPIFAVGHGCSTNWSLFVGGETKSAKVISIETMPTYEVPNITPDIRTSSGKDLSVSMRDCSIIVSEPKGKGYAQLQEVVNSYGDWIKRQYKRIEGGEITNELKGIAKKNLAGCNKAYERMCKGLDLLESDLGVQKAFSLMNHAMLLQQEHVPRTIRKIKINKELGGVIDGFDGDFTKNSVEGKWRAFQIGFILMTLSSVVNNDDPMHETVELIWFPTGGGKTEAYLGLAAFTMLYERICHAEDASGVQVLMRYTLRLLTAQQLQRASTLICALESLREKNRISGGKFSIGLWVGSATTPNKGKNAIDAYNNLMKKDNVSNPFLLDRCPWCSAQIGPIKKEQGSGHDIFGYKKRSNTIELCCSDKNCDFYNGLPVYLIDSDIYEQKPSLVIGTVDKFAMLAWEPKVRALFGIDENGNRNLNPPSLIIQDELHLISGPLGSMAGLYEPLIEELCTDHRTNQAKCPKIVCATATTRRYKEQVLNLYGRNDTRLFPPPAIDADDSFFAVYHRESNNQLSPGRKYVGINAPGLGSQMSVQVRTFAALLDASNRLKPNDRDPWHTLLVFYNSIRELGGGKTLFQGDIPEQLKAVYNRSEKIHLKRYINNDIELTSRLKAEEVPQAITKLQVGLEKISQKEIQDILEEIQDKLNNDGLELDCRKWLAKIKNQNLSIEGYSFLYHCYSLLKKDGNIPDSLKTLIDKLKGQDVIDACIASNIIEVGIDIDRLSLMAIVGQPKTTAQYIQVSGRVGRNWRERPGLVITIYSAAKPRDRSHYEHFIAYHQRLYTQVEPSSVTPWSLPAIKRALAAVCIGYMRQTLPSQLKPNHSTTLEKLDEFINIVLDKRKLAMSKNEFEQVKFFLEKKREDWQKYVTTFQEWGEVFHYKQGDVVCSIENSVPVSKDCAWAIAPTSMRNVDKESKFGIVVDPYRKENNNESN